jgi:maleate isomerase
VHDIQALESLADALRLATGASRVTIRLRTGEDFPVTAESLADDVPSLRDVQIDPRAGATFDFLSTERRLLVQSDVSRQELAPPPEIVAMYGIRSQMVAPVTRGDELAALISVHDVTRTRVWSEDEQAAIGRAATEVATLLARATAAT